jgi:hypothetical protein
MAARKPIRERFDEKWQFIAPTGCWEWQAGISSRGYGAFSIRSVNYGAHRISYELYVGPIPEGMFVCHKCDNPKCVNPEHLFLGTPDDNMQDKMQKGRHILPLGEDASNAILKEHEARLIKEFMKRHPTSLKKRTGSTRFLADWFGVGTGLVSHISKGTHWGHI